MGKERTYTMAIIQTGNRKQLLHLLATHMLEVDRLFNECDNLDDRYSVLADFRLYMQGLIVLETTGTNWDNIDPGLKAAQTITK
jgi:hypothetical protein